MLPKPQFVVFRVKANNFDFSARQSKTDPGSLKMKKGDLISIFEDDHLTSSGYDRVWGMNFLQRLDILTIWAQPLITATGGQSVVKSSGTV